MIKDKKVYVELAKLLCEEFQKKQGAALLANLTKRNMDALDVSKEKILSEIREELLSYQDEDGNSLTEEEKELVLELVRKDIWGYGIIDDLIHDKEISDIKLYNANNIQIKRLGKRGGCDITFEDDKDYNRFVTKILERNKVNLGTANAIQTFTDSDQSDFILRITVLSAIVADSKMTLMAIRKIPKEKYTLEDLKKAGMFGDTMPDELISILEDAALFGKGMLFTGKGASGKTTLMNALISEIPHDESVMICQENAELFDLKHPNLFAAHVITNNGDSKISYDLGDLTRAALLVDLDRVIVGEVKEGSEAAGLSKASMTGHKCWTSVHGENCEMAVDKMADYISQATGYSTRDSLKQLQGFEYVVHLRNYQVDEIIRITGWDAKSERLILEQVYPKTKERG
ncbi:ATPase, T2SS/T4P/T4SS family [Oliverpabstia intestinalis]|uniref:ATPase, T2SS/T4P/T4SS family n=1 Tax=Oliverpabstia intestinalis TaxID=2606633 RepID=UPI003F8C78C6